MYLSFKNTEGTNDITNTAEEATISDFFHALKLAPSKLSKGKEGG
jgi:hypothetical protein